MKSKNGQFIIKYQKKLSAKDHFMLGSLDEEMMYFMHNRRRYIHALNQIDKLRKNNHQNIRVLDIGTSPFTFILSERYKKAQIYSVDYSNNFRDTCKLNGICFKKVDLNKQKISFGKTKFDLVIFLEVIEHLGIDGKKIINNVLDLMEPGGYCIIQTPNKYSLKVLITSILSFIGGNKLFTSPQVSKEFIHFKEYSLGELSKLIGETKKVRLVQKNHPLYFDEIDSAMVYRKYLIFSWPLVLVNHLIVKYLPLLRRGIQIIFQKINYS